MLLTLVSMIGPLGIVSFGDDAGDGALTPVMTIGDLVLTARGEKGVTCQYTLHNNTEEEIPAVTIHIQGYWSHTPVLDLTDRKPRKGAGGTSLIHDKPFSPDETRTMTKGATYAKDEFRYLHVIVYVGKFAHEKMTPGTIGSIDVRDAVVVTPQPPTPPVVKEEAPAENKPQITQRPATKQGNVDSVATPVATAKPPQQSTFWDTVLTVLFFTCSGGFVLLVLGLFGFMIWMSVTASKAQNRPIPGMPVYERIVPGDVVESDRYDAAWSIGFDPLVKPPARVRAAIETVIGPSDLLRAFERKTKGGVFHLCEIKQEDHRSNSSDDSGSSYTMTTYATVLLFEGPDSVCFPPMNAQPAVGGALAMSRVFGPLMRVLGGPSFGKPRFLEDSEFNKRVMIGAMDPEGVRPILTQEVRDVLKQHTDLNIQMHDDCIAVKLMSSQLPRTSGMFSDDITQSALVDPTMWPEFVARATKVIQAFRKAEHQLRQKEPSTEQVSRTALDEFLALPAPRRLRWRRLRSATTCRRPRP